MALPPGVKTTYIDRPELTETFSDSLETFTFSDNLLRFDLCCTRLGISDSPNRNNPPTAKKYPVARVVMPLDTAVTLFNQLNQLFGALEQSGAIKREISGSVITPATKH